MNNYIIYHLADIHLKNKRRTDFRQLFNTVIDFIKNDQKPMQTEKICIIAGDIFNDMETSYADDICDFNYMIKTLCEHCAWVITVPGNHDKNLNNSTRPDLIEPLQGQPINFIHIANTGTKMIMPNLAVSFIHPVYTSQNTVENINDFAHLLKNVSGGSSTCHILILHEDINSHGEQQANRVLVDYTSEKFTYGTTQAKDPVANYILHGRFDTAVLSKMFTAVFLGHIHEHMQLQHNVAYPGALMQQNIGETISKGFIRWNFLYNNTNQWNIACANACKAGSITSQFIPVYDMYASLKYTLYNTTLYVNSRIADPGLFPTKPLRIVLETHNASTKAIDTICNKIKNTYGFLPVVNSKDIPETTTLIGNCATDKTEQVKILSELLSSTQFAANLRKLSNETGCLLSADAIKDSILKKHTAVAAATVAMTAVVIPSSSTTETKYKSGDRWRLLELRWSNLVCYGANNYIDFTSLEKNIVGLIADNRCGKSALLDILVYALYGETLRGNKADVLNKHSIHGSVDLTIELNGQIYKLSKYWRDADHTTNTIHIITQDMQDTQNTQDTQGTQNTQVLENHTASNKILDAKHIVELFGDKDTCLSTILASQNKDNDFIHLTPAKRYAFIRKILALDELGEQENNINLEILVLKKQMAASKEQILGAPFSPQTDGAKTIERDLIQKKTTLDGFRLRIKQLLKERKIPNCSPNYFKIELKNKLTQITILEKEISSIFDKSLSDKSIFDKSLFDKSISKIDEQITTTTIQLSNTTTPLKYTAFTPSAPPVSIEKISRDITDYRNKYNGTISSLEHPSDLFQILSTLKIELSEVTTNLNFTYTEYSKIQQNETELKNLNNIINDLNSIKNELKCDSERIMYITNEQSELTQELNTLQKNRSIWEEKDHFRKHIESEYNNKLKHKNIHLQKIKKYKNEITEKFNKKTTVLEKYKKFDISIDEIIKIIRNRENALVEALPVLLQNLKFNKLCKKCAHNNEYVNSLATQPEDEIRQINLETIEEDNNTIIQLDHEILVIQNNITNAEVQLEEINIELEKNLVTISNDELKSSTKKIQFIDQEIDKLTQTGAKNKITLQTLNSTQNKRKAQFDILEEKRKQCEIQIAKLSCGTIADTNHNQMITEKYNIITLQEQTLKMLVNTVKQATHEYLTAQLNILNKTKEYKQKNDALIILNQNGAELKKLLSIAEQEQKLYDENITEYNTINEQIQNIIIEINAAETQLHKIQQYQEKISQHEKLVYDYSVLTNYKQCLGKDGLQGIIVKKSLKHIEQLTNDILDQIVPGELKVTVTVSKEEIKLCKAKRVKKDSGGGGGSDGTKTKNYKLLLDIMVRCTLGKVIEIPLAMTSGFQQFIISLAFRNAFAKVCQQPLGDFLIIDEGFVCLDTENMNRIIDILPTLKSLYKFVLIISHLDKLKIVFDKAISIERYSSDNIVYSKIAYGASAGNTTNEKQKKQEKQEKTQHLPGANSSEAETETDVDSAIIEQTVKNNKPAFYCKCCAKTFTTGQITRHKNSATHLNMRKKYKSNSS